MISKVLFVIISLALLASCVQQSSKKTVLVKLHIANIKEIQTVGIRGNEQPLSWDNDYELKAMPQDSIYTAMFSLVSGYRFTEVKFTVNGQ